MKTNYALIVILTQKDSKQMFQISLNRNIKQAQAARREYFISNDKTIIDGCSKKRPDIILDMRLYHIVIEVDEYQHRNYSEECEYTRMFQIHQNFSEPEKGIIFIRFNPDLYKVNGNKLNPSLSSRLANLKDYIDILKRTYNENGLKTLKLCYMYYNKYTGKPKCEDLEYSLLGYGY